jgi:hypothetical protein
MHFEWCACATIQVERLQVQALNIEYLLPTAASLVSSPRQHVVVAEAAEVERLALQCQPRALPLHKVAWLHLQVRVQCICST